MSDDDARPARPPDPPDPSSPRPGAASSHARTPSSHAGPPSRPPGPPSPASDPPALEAPILPGESAHGVLEAVPGPLGVWALAWPTIVSFGAQTFVRFADFIMVGGLGPEALAAVGLGGQVYWLVQSLVNLAPMGLAAILARAWGARDFEEVDVALRQSLVLGALTGLAITVLGLPFCDDLIRVYGVEEGVVHLGGAYVYWLMLSTVPFALSFVFGAGLRAAGDVYTPLWIGLATNVLNVFLNWILIFGHLGAPALGVAGAGMASGIAVVFQTLVFWVMWRRRMLVLVPGPASFVPDRRMLRRIAAIGYPAAIEQGLFQVGLLGFQRIMSLYGTAAIAAYNIGAQILSFSFIPGIGFATAAGTLVGQHLGEGEPDAAARSGWRANLGAMLSMSVIGATVITFREPLARAFSDDPEVVALTMDFVFILGLVQPLMAIEFAMGGALRGAGDTLFPMLTIFVGLFLVRLIPAFVLIHVTDATIQMVWCALILDYATKATLLVGRFRRGRWRTLVV